MSVGKDKALTNMLSARTRNILEETHAIRRSQFGDLDQTGPGVRSAASLGDLSLGLKRPRR